MLDGTMIAAVDSYPCLLLEWPTAASKFATETAVGSLASTQIAIADSLGNLDWRRPHHLLGTMPTAIATHH